MNCFKKIFKIYSAYMTFSKMRDDLLKGIKPDFENLDEHIEFLETYMFKDLNVYELSAFSDVLQTFKEDSDNFEKRADIETMIDPLLNFLTDEMFKSAISWISIFLFVFAVVYFTIPNLKF